MPIQLPQEMSSRLGESMNNMGGSIELPFIAPTMWVINGDPRLDNGLPQKSALYFGGWAVQQVEIQNAMQHWNQALAEPGGFAARDIITQDGKTIKGMVSRHVKVAPIGIRQSWVNKNDKNSPRSPVYLPGTSQHVQALCYITSLDKDGYVPHGPVVLSAKGYQAKYLMNSFTTWKKESAEARSRIGDNIPANVFWMAIGTFGKERKTEMVGNNGSQSPITPVSCFLPEAINEEYLEAQYVGEDTASRMVFLLDKAYEWLHAWDTQQAPRIQAPAQAQAAAPGRNSGGGYGIPEPPEDPPFDDESIPF